MSHARGRRLNPGGAAAPAAPGQEEGRGRRHPGPQAGARQGGPGAGPNGPQPGTEQAKGDRRKPAAPRRARPRTTGPGAAGPGEPRPPGPGPARAAARAPGGPPQPPRRAGTPRDSQGTRAGPRRGPGRGPQPGREPRRPPPQRRSRRGERAGAGMGPRIPPPFRSAARNNGHGWGPKGAALSAPGARGRALLCMGPVMGPTVRRRAYRRGISAFRAVRWCRLDTRCSGRPGWVFSSGDCGTDSKLPPVPRTGPRGIPR